MQPALLLEYFPLDFFAFINTIGPISEELARTYMTQLFSAVSACHSLHIYHRDIKLENLMLSADGNLKLIDFGLAYRHEAGRGTVEDHEHGQGATDGDDDDDDDTFPQALTKERRVPIICGHVGSPPYMTPEMLGKRRWYGAAAPDEWSIIVCMFIMLHKCHPFKSASLGDPHFVLLADEDYERFWQHHGQRVTVSSAAQGSNNA
jgi:serine/threonine protein kinase